MTNIKDLKKSIRAFMQAHYTDERLTQLLAHAQDGKLSFMSCCCFIGIVSAPDAAFESGRPARGTLHVGHTMIARRLDGAIGAEWAFARLGNIDAVRRRVLIPMIRAEMKRREHMTRTEITATPSFEAVAV